MSDLNKASSPQRIDSIDAFRGFVIASMVFVNYIAGMTNIPGWLKHLPGDQFGMTFVDVVFPAFLFIVGMVIPIALERRLQRSKSVALTFGHVIVRFLGLIIIGVLMVNIGSISPEKAGIGKYLWGLLMFCCVVLVWTAYPKGWKPGLVLRGLGILGLATLAAVYRREDGSWLQTSWWGILGLIGWAYLAACVVFFVVRKNTTALLAALALFIAWYEAGAAGGLTPAMDLVHQWVHTPTQIGSHGAIVIAGIIAGVIATGPAGGSEKLRNLVLFGLALLAAGYLFRPLHGFHKNNASESWALASAGWTLLAYSIFYFVMDMQGLKKWSIIFQPAGRNPLLAYILPSMIIYAMLTLGLSFPAAIRTGLPGIIHGIIFTAAIIAITGGANRLGVLLRF